MPKTTREQLLLNLTRSQIVNAIKDDLEGDEQIMKEVWEQCEGDNERAIVRTEMRAIITRIKQGRTADIRAETPADPDAHGGKFLEPFDRGRR